MTGEMWSTIQGVTQAKAIFAALPAIAKKRFLAGTAQTVEAIGERARANLLRSPSVRTRALYNAITWTVSKTSGFGRVGVARTTTAVGSLALRKTIRVRGTIISVMRNGRRTIEVVQPSKYAHLVERGTIHMRAEPFMTPAAEQEKPRHLQRCYEAGIAIERDASL